MASREAEKEAQMTAPVSHSSSKESKKHHTSGNDSSETSKEETTAKRSAPSDDSEVPKKKQKGSLLYLHVRTLRDFISTFITYRVIFQRR